MILGERVQLRAIERADIPTFVRWFNDPEVTQYLGVAMPMSTADEERWFEGRLGDRSNEARHRGQHTLLQMVALPGCLPSPSGDVD